MMYFLSIIDQNTLFLTQKYGVYLIYMLHFPRYDGNGRSVFWLSKAPAERQEDAELTE